MVLGSSPRVAGLAIVLAVVAGTLFMAPAPARAALEAPAYAVGDRWVYALEGTLAAFPGLNDSAVGAIDFRLVGRVEVQVVGREAFGLRVSTRTSGFLNGTIRIPDGGLPGTVAVTGSFASDVLEVWEDRSYLTVASNATTTYIADVTYIITTRLEVETRVDATTTYASVPAFRMDPGQVATAEYASSLDVNSTVTFLGETMSFENRTDVASTWRREVVDFDTVTVEAGTFGAYELNQSLGLFPGISGGLLAGGNETAHFSNDVGFYVRREAYANGTRVADMRLRSYAYAAAGPSGPSALDLVIFVALPVAAIAAGAWAIRRRRKARRSEARSQSPPPTGGDPGAR